MLISTAPDTEKGPGYAVFTLRGDGSASLPAVLDDAVFSIRSSLGATLGKGKWVQGKATFRADSLHADQGTLHAAFGPSIIDHLDPIETYRLFLETGGQEYSGTFYLANVLPSSARVKDIPSGAPVEDNSTAPESGTTLTDDAVQAEELIPAFPEPPEESESPPSPVVSPRSGRKRTGLYILIAVFALLWIGIAAAVYWFVFRHDADTPAIATEESVDSVRTFLASGPSIEALRSKFADTVWTDANADARFLLAEELAGRGNADAMSVVAEFYDPTSSVASGSIVKDAEQAYKSYTAARNAGQDGMDERLATLREWVEKEAEKGSDDARRLLHNW